MMFEVTTAITAYTVYFVEAPSAEIAKNRIQSHETRPDYADASRDVGYGCDEHVIDCRKMDCRAALDAPVRESEIADEEQR